jgi:hypothetical protein
MRTVSLLAPWLACLVLAISARTEGAAPARASAKAPSTSASAAAAPSSAPSAAVTAGSAPPAISSSAPRAGPAPAPGSPAAEPKATEEPSWTDFELDGTHAFVGLTLGPGMSGWWPYAEKHVSVEPAFFFGVRGGATFDHAELGFELAPMTWVRSFEVDPSVSFLVTIGGFPELGEHVYWPLRFGLGLSALNTPDGKVLMQGRVDLIGLAFQYGHLLFEIDLPSTRFHSEFANYGIWGWLCNVSVSYFVI